jgi:hypothetical protein
MKEEMEELREGRRKKIERGKKSDNETLYNSKRN